MKKVIELIRVSTEAQAATHRASIPAQKAVNLRTCTNHGLEIVRSIQIADVSGACVLLAPEMQELIKLMQSPEICGVVAREFSRLMRPENFEDYALLQAFAESNTVLYLPEGPIDFSSKAGRFMGTIRAATAGLERMDILERIWSAKEAKRRRGELAQSPAVLPFGVGYEEGRGFYYKPDAERVREAFRLFRAGKQSYAQLAGIVGVTPRGMNLIMRNPIWTGWRVIDKKRDLSAAGRYSTIGGRQGDRRKIARDAAEVIRIRVISEPLISEEDFQAVQRVMDLKKAKHWRTQGNVKHRFVYNGFLSCAACGQVVHTALAGRDYYACKGRRSAHTCTTGYMARERLERDLDFLFAERMTTPDFIAKCLQERINRQKQNDSAGHNQRLTAELNRLVGKRNRVLECFFDGVISRDERTSRLELLDRDIQLIRELLRSHSPANEVRLESLVESFAQVVEWQYWTRDQKRAVLTALVPDIRVADYKVVALGLHPALFSNQDTRTGTDSSPPPA